MKCILCGRRKAKRYCPAKKGSICSVCCGEKRGVEINCPLDCPYYIEGQRYHQNKVSKQRLRKEGVSSFIRRAELYNKNPEIFAKIELAFVDLFRTYNKIGNRDLAEALELVLKTLDTEKKGLIYDYRSENLLANETAGIIIKIIREEKDSLQLRRTRISIDYGRDIMQEFLKEVNYYIDNDSNPQSYLIHILRYHPENTGASQDTGKIIFTP